MEKILKDTQDLIYDLIFSEETEYLVNVGDYIRDIYKYDSFIDEIKLILKKSKVTLIKEKISVDPDSVTWKIKVKK